jgi:hypothetical protein
MRIYRIEMDEGESSSINHHILAEDMKDAESRADKILGVLMWKKCIKRARIIAIEELFEIEVVK